MSQKRVYFCAELFPPEIFLTDREVLHKLKTVVRCREEDKVILFNGKGKEAEYTVSFCSPRELALSFLRDLRRETAPSRSLVLAFPFLKESKTDLILQKATELGVSKLVPFIPFRNNNLSRPSANRYQRWEKIIIEACRQSLRLWVPELSQVCDFSRILERKEDLKLFADKEGDLITDLKVPGTERSIFFITGPEGGFNPQEKQEFKDKGFKPVSLGRNVLRAETAAIFMTGLVSYFYDKKG